MSMFYLPRSPLFHACFLLLVTCCCSSTAKAEYRTGGINFSLQVEHNETDWQYASTVLTSKSSKLGVQIQESLASRLSGTLYAGYLDLSQPGNPLQAARFTTGYYGGIDLTLLLLDTPWLNVDLTGGYAYQDTEGSEAGTTVNFVWYDTYAQLGMSVPLSDRLKLRAAGGIVDTNGEQRVSGSGAQLLSYHEQKQEYYTAGLNYWLDGSGYISLYWLGGTRDGFRISFHRGF